MGFNIQTIGTYLPSNKIVYQEMNGPDKQIFEKNGGAKIRYWAIDPKETNSYMGSEALKTALKEANMTYSELDLLINGSATFDHPIPHRSCLTQELMDPLVLMPSIDVGSTCLGFISSCIVANGLLSQGYNSIAIINSEKSSNSLNPNHLESYLLFGDGATATIIDGFGQSQLLANHLINYPAGARNTIVYAGGNVHLGYIPTEKENYYFQMSGISLLKQAKVLLPNFISELFNKAKLQWKDIDLVIPHQASKIGLELFQKMFQIPQEKWVVNIDSVGNLLSASIPMALQEVITSGRLKRGQTILIIGTGAGFSMGGLIIKY